MVGRMVDLFRTIALVEGVTTILLFFVAMPLKYLAGQPWLVPPVGWIHGIAFIAYVLAMIPALRELGVGPMGWLRTFAASFVPFGTFVNDRWLKRVQAVPASERGVVR
jgi:integral membrane protein